MVIHSRDASQDTFDIMKREHAGTTGGVIHCYSGSLEMAREYVKLGYYLGIGGVVTFKNSKVLNEWRRRSRWNISWWRRTARIWRRRRIAENETVRHTFLW